MKRYIIILFVCIFLSFNKYSDAQELPIYSQYMFNEYLINSAYAGTYYFTPVIINHRNQWVGFGDAAPQTSSLSLHGALGKKSAIGSSIIYDKTTPITRTQMELSYTYQARLNNKFILSLSLSGTWNMTQYIYQENMTYSEMTNGIIDEANQMDENWNEGDLNIGLILLNDYFDIGFSIRNMLAPEPNSTNLNETVNRVKYILIHGSYLGRNNNQSPIALIPSFVIRKMGITTYDDLFEIDLNMRFIYRNRIWTGISYRTHENAICALIGLNTPRAFFGYSYDIGTSSNLSTYHNGSHNIAIGFKIGGKNKRAIRNQTPLYLDIDSEWKRIKISDWRHKSVSPY